MGRRGIPGRSGTERETMKTFAAEQLYNAEDHANSAVRVLSDVALMLGEFADGVQSGGTLPDVSPVLELLGDVQKDVDRVRGLAAAYQIHRKSQAVLR